MGIKVFINSLLVLGIAAYFIPVENKISEDYDKDIPLVVFEKPLMYTIDEVSVSSIVIASEAIKYKNRDEMYNGDITLKNKPPQNDFILENVKANVIISKDNLLTFKGDVVYERDDFIDLKSEKMYYHTINKILYNDVPFVGTYNNNLFDGTDLYLESNNDYIKSKDVHFEIDVNNKK